MPEPTCWAEEVELQRRERAATLMYLRNTANMPLGTPDQERKWLEQARAAVAHGERDNDGDN